MSIIAQLRSLLLPAVKDMRGGACEIRNRTKDWTKEELTEALAAVAMEREPGDWFPQYYTARKEIDRLRNVLKSDYHNDKSINRALHMADLEEKNRRLKREVRAMQEAAEKKNVTLKATGLIVGCTGCEAGAPTNSENITEATVQRVENIAIRMRTWWENHKGRHPEKVYENFPLIDTGRA